MTNYVQEPFKFLPQFHTNTLTNSTVHSHKLYSGNEIRKPLKHFLHTWQLKDSAPSMIQVVTINCRQPVWVDWLHLTQWWLHVTEILFLLSFPVTKVTESYTWFPMVGDYHCKPQVFHSSTVSYPRREYVLYHYSIVKSMGTSNQVK